MLAIALILGTTAAAALPAEPERVGQIIIIGNETTLHGDILELLAVYPGQELPTRDEFKKAEIRLIKKFRDRLDSERLFIEALNPGSPYRDLVVHFPEKKTRKK